MGAAFSLKIPEKKVQKYSNYKDPSGLTIGHKGTGEDTLSIPEFSLDSR